MLLMEVRRRKLFLKCLHFISNCAYVSFIVENESETGAGGAVVDEGTTSDEPAADAGDASLEAGVEPADTTGDSGSTSSEDTPASDSASDDLPSNNLADEAGAGGVAPPPPSPSSHGSSDDEPHDPNDLSWLRNAIRGEPDEDYPILSDIPKTSFKCSEQSRAGYYGDPEARCQVFHICQKPDDRMDSFLCPNGTIFSQKNFVCVWWWQYDCSQTEKDYELNANLYSAGGSDYQDQANQVEAGGDASGYTQSDDGGFFIV